MPLRPTPPTLHQAEPISSYTPPPSHETRGILAVISLICGIFSVFCFCCICQLPFPIIGIITGSFALKSPKRKLAQVGIILSIIGLIITLLWFLLSMMGQVSNPGFMKWESPFPYGPATTMPAD